MIYEFCKLIQAEKIYQNNSYRGAFISLEVVPVRGVTSWAEVQYEELPEAVQGKYAAPEE